MMFDCSVTVFYNGVTLTGYMDTLTGECQFLMKGQMRSFSSVKKAMEWWQDNN